MSKKTSKSNTLKDSSDHTHLPGRTKDIFLPNREYFFQTATPVFEAEKTNNSFVLAYIDLRGFKAINDEMSHAAGNDALNAYFQRLTKQFRSFVVAREGGDEFLLLAQHPHKTKEKREQAASAIYNRIISCNFAFEGFDITSRTALAESHPEAPAESLKDLFLLADAKLSKVRKLEKSGVEIHPMQGNFEF